MRDKSYQQAASNKSLKASHQKTPIKSNKAPKLALMASTIMTMVTGVTLAAGSAAMAQETYLMADRMIDVASGDIKNNPVVVIEDERIKSVTFDANFQVPSGANIIRLAGKTIMPGLMDMHTHVNGDADMQGYRGLSYSIHRFTLKGAKNAHKTLMAGFTTIRNVGAADFQDVALRDAIKEGDVAGPRMFVSGPSMGVTGGHCDNNFFPKEMNVKGGGVADGPWEVRAKVRENIKYGADLIKFCATGGVLSKGTKVGVQQYTYEEMKALVDEAHMRGLTVAAHAHGTDGIKTAIRAGVDSVKHSSFLDEEAIELAREYGTFLSMDIYNTEYILGMGEKAGFTEESLNKERQVGARQRQSFTNAVKAGLKVVFGSDSGVYPHGDNGKQLARMVRFGMTPMQAVQAATIMPAALLKQETNIGQIKEGLYADIIAVEGNPLDNMASFEDVDFVMKGGTVYKNKD